MSRAGGEGLGKGPSRIRATAGRAGLDSLRWCGYCQRHGDHPSDQHPGIDHDRMEKAVKAAIPELRMDEPPAFVRNAVHQAVLTYLGHVRGGAPKAEPHNRKPTA